MSTKPTINFKAIKAADKSAYAAHQTAAYAPCGTNHSNIFYINRNTKFTSLPVQAERRMCMFITLGLAALVTTIGTVGTTTAAAAGAAAATAAYITAAKRSGTHRTHAGYESSQRSRIISDNSGYAGIAQKPY